ncbi:HNH endonuclease [bacterium]|nr:HNH endonuclease [bacterium]
MLPKDYIPKKPFPNFKWKWACLQCTEGLNDPVILLGVLFRMRKLEKMNAGIKYSSDEFANELVELSRDTADSVGVDLARRTGERNLIRNSGQYWRAVNLITPGSRSGVIELTDFGRRVADREISQTEFAAITVQTFRLPNPQIQSQEECDEWLKHGLVLYPLKLILEIGLELLKRSEGYLTTEELVRIVIPLSGCHAELQDYVNFILWYRDGAIDLSGWPDCIPAANDIRIAREYLLFLSNYGYIEKKSGHDRLSEQYFICDYLADEIRQILSQNVKQESLLTILQNMRIEKYADEVERKRVQTIRVTRPNQANFRKAVLQACERCVITNVTMPEILEAAHIKPFKYKGEDTVANGFAMRTDIHTLFDTGHLRIAPDGKIELSSRARMDYGASIPPRIVIPDFTNRDFLRWRYENYNGM